MTKNIDFPAQFDLRRFLSVQAHDLKTPFNHIVGFSRIILKGQDGPLTDFQKEDITTVYNSSVRALMFISNLIEIARISGGEKELSLTEVDDKQLVEQAVAHWKKNHPAREVQVESELACQIATVRVDEAQMRLVISGLMSCAAEYTEGAAKILITVTEEPDWLVLTIQSVGKKPPKPSELDLEMYGYISRAYIEQHGGEFRRQTENEDGATISFALPKRPV